MSPSGRPGCARMPGDSQRMPLEAAEALLWGKETHNQHTFLYRRMKELEEHHRAYDTRIQVTEAVAESAEAATSRIRHIEQQITAIESDEHDRPFDKWATEEITNFKSFVEQNKSVRPKQIELGKQVSTLEDSIREVKDVSKRFGILLRRIECLEVARIKDANRIVELEQDVSSLTASHQNHAMDNKQLRYNITHRQPCGRMMPPPPPLRRSSPEASDMTEETEDENEYSVSLKNPAKTLIQVPRSPEIKQKDLSLAFVSPPNKGQNGIGVTSARLRMMQRESIYDPKKSREHQHQLTRNSIFDSRPGPNSRVVHLPASQIISEPSVEKLTGIRENTPRCSDPLGPTQLIVKLSTGKRKLSEDIYVSRLTRAQAKRGNDIANSRPGIHVPAKIMSAVETRVVQESATKKRKPNNTQISTQPRPDSQRGAAVPTKNVSDVANPVKTALRKVAMTKKGKSCNGCSKSHRSCDHVRPVCGNCKNKPQRGPCIYNSPADDQAQRPQPVPATIGSPKKKTMKTNVTLSPKKSSSVHHKYTEKKSKEHMPEKPKKSLQSSTHRPSLVVASMAEKLPVPKTIASSSSTSRPPLAMPVTLDWNTLEEMKKNNLVI
ncbi:hypothetical protein GQ44DRAFT_821200 [Phaeosphaeriaceae sp. PMI808]|nr:hypothetical protein GQ44DRAFT_821200 [Phaeosphaeriaceae sp. PMI808]